MIAQKRTRAEGSAKGRVRRHFSSLTWVIARRLTFVALVPLVLASCGGGSDEPERVCHMVRPATVAKELRGSGTEVQGSLRPHADETPGLSVCSYRGRRRERAGEP